MRFRIHERALAVCGEMIEFDHINGWGGKTTSLRRIMTTQSIKKPQAWKAVQEAIRLNWLQNTGLAAPYGGYLYQLPTDSAKLQPIRSVWQDYKLQYPDRATTLLGGKNGLLG